MKAPVKLARGSCSPSIWGVSCCKTWASLTDVGKLDRWELWGGDG